MLVILLAVITGISNLFIVDSASAATRTVSFSSLARSTVENAAVRFANDFSDCLVGISNLSNVTQNVVAVNFLVANDPGFGDYTLSLRAQTSNDNLRTFAATPATTGCSTLLPLSTCYIRMPLQVVDFSGGTISHCMGKISVADAGTAGVSGSVIATGAVQLVQEAQVLGGVLSGAYYASNAFTPASYMNEADSVEVWPSDSHNMNAGCTYACLNTAGSSSVGYSAGRWSKARCDAHCGLLQTKHTGQGNVSTTLNYWSWGTFTPAAFARSGGLGGLMGWTPPSSSYLYLSGVDSNLAMNASTPGVTERRSVIGLGFDSGGIHDRKYFLMPPGETEGVSLRAPMSMGGSTAPYIDPIYNESRAKFAVLGLDAFSVRKNESPASSVRSFYATSRLNAAQCSAGGMGIGCLTGTTNTTGFTDTEPVSENEPTSLVDGSTDAAPLIAPDINGARNNSYGPHVQNYYTRTALPNFAGGMVYEMEIGSIASICSGNKDARNVENLGIDRTVSVHPGDLGSGMSYQAQEKLVCHHRHSLPDLFLRVQQSYPFTINAGQPF